MEENLFWEMKMRLRYLIFSPSLLCLCTEKNAFGSTFLGKYKSVMMPSHNPANALATYLAHHGAENYKTMVIIDQPFGRVRELWSLDMGLGPVEPRFVAVYESDLNPVVINEMEEPIVEDGNIGQAPGDEEMVEVIVIEDD
ncbi:hypothetical protein ACET3Z_000349 [Daucus carota]